MAISVETPFKEYTGNASTVRFDFSPHFSLSAADHLEVFLDGVLQEAGYTQDSTGVVFGTAPGTGVVVRLARDTPLDQPTTITGLRSFGLSAITDALDRVARVFQEIRQTLTQKADTGHTHPVTDLTGTASTSGLKFVPNEDGGVDLALWDQSTSAYRRVRLVDGALVVIADPA